jgi:Cof subfamily protein (haloacid dehalogenase superfamily)
MPRPGLLALDLDGTLLGDASFLPDAHAETVAWARSVGIQVAIVTGRPLLTTRWVWERLGLDTPVVCFNGVWVGVPGEAPFALEALDEGEVHRIVQELSGLEGSICVYPDSERWLIHRYIPRTSDWSRRYGVTIEEEPRMLEDWRGPSCKVMFVCEPELLQPSIERFRARIGDRFHVVASQEDRFEIHRPGITKAWGLSKLADAMGVDQEAVWAVGDAANDEEMIAWAGNGCAMGHAPERVKAQAQHVLPPIAEHGLAAVRPLLERALAAD